MNCLESSHCSLGKEQRFIMTTDIHLLIASLISLLSINCLINLSKEIKNNEKIIDYKRLLNKFNEIVSSIDEKGDNKNKNCSLLIKCIKNYIIEFVKIKGEDLIEDYNDSIGNSTIRDKYIAIWIDKTITHMESGKVSLTSNLSSY